MEEEQGNQPPRVGNQEIVAAAGGELGLAGAQGHPQLQALAQTPDQIRLKVIFCAAIVSVDVGSLLVDIYAKGHKEWAITFVALSIIASASSLGADIYALVREGLHRYQVLCLCCSLCSLGIGISQLVISLTEQEKSISCLVGYVYILLLGFLSLLFTLLEHFMQTFRTWFQALNLVQG